MYRTGVSRDFQARHFLKGDYGEESTAHSHPYRVEVICEVSELGPQGFSVNIAVLESVFERELGAIEDHLLNDLPFFLNRQTSLENLALYLHGRMSEGLSSELEEGELHPGLLEIRIRESQSAWASYRAAP